TKPFSFLELIERLRALTRRARVQESTLISIGDLRVDLIGRRATRDGTRLDLTARDRVDDRVRGLRGGADDYLTKPF
ncbi:hypothetical protein Q6327_29140, partial [Klebsiella pneumoniae]|nr:hypothetical protein [Klebsiella pneumoniae]